MLEIEKKYLFDKIITNLQQKYLHIVYQWYTYSNNSKSVKEKCIFDLTRNKTIYVRVIKTKIKPGVSDKNIQHLECINANALIGTKFVLKRRIITQNQIFIDQFIRSNGICCQLMEYEGKDINNDILPCFSNIIDVTNNLAYYNENMCTEFTQQDFEHFIFLNHLLKR